MPFDTKYRPRSISECIGHEQAVTTLQGYIKKQRPPSLLLFTGPTSVGKTTLARAFASDLNGLNEQGQPHDYQEVDGGSYRTKEDLLGLVRASHFMPQAGKFRIIHIDEFQHCFEAKTQVLTDKGSISAKELHDRINLGEEFKVASFNHTNNTLEWKRITKAMSKTTSKQSVKVGPAYVTHDHDIYTKESGYQEAKNSQGLTGIIIQKQPVPRTPDISLPE